MTTIKIALSGKEQQVMDVKGTEVNGFFVHHPVFGTDWLRKIYTVSHSQSGQALLTYFKTRKNAVAFCEELAKTYNGHCTAAEVVEQFKNRGSKPSFAEIAHKHGVI